MASRNLAHLHPDLYPLALKHQRLCADSGIDLLIYCTWRSPAEQEELYAQGRTKPGRIVTWARPGESKHNHVEKVNGEVVPSARAYDCVPLRNGKPVWGTSGNGIDDDPTDDDRDDLELWQRVGHIGESVGLSWAGRWSRGKREFPHFELP